MADYRSFGPNWWCQWLKLKRRGYLVQLVGTNGGTRKANFDLLYSLLHGNSCSPRNWLSFRLHWFVSGPVLPESDLASCNRSIKSWYIPVIEISGTIRDVTIPI